MSAPLTIIEGCAVQWDGKQIRFTARGRIDDDGSGGAHGDKFHESETSLKLAGRSLNADAVRYIVVPPQIIRGVPPVVLGCLCEVSYNGTTAEAVVGDVGPHDRLGEMSRALAIALGIDSNPNTGGVDAPVVEYLLTPGVAAPGFDLQPS